MSHSVAWYADKNERTTCSFQSCKNDAAYFISGMKIHDSCNIEGSVPGNDGEDRELEEGDLRACLETEEVGFLLCYNCLRLFNREDLDPGS